MTGSPGTPQAGITPARGGRRRFAAPAMRDALAPVIEAMLREARAQAGEIVAHARREAQEAVARARHDGDQKVTRARQEGRALAAPLAAALLGRGRRDARSILLLAQREAHEELRAQVRAGVLALRDDPGYAPLLERLRSLAVATAGPGATVTEDPEGGAVARGPDVVVDCSLPRLADAAVDALGAEVERLWTPPRRPRQAGERGEDGPGKRGEDGRGAG